jgi:hypothetical protein
VPADTTSQPDIITNLDSGPVINGANLIHQSAIVNEPAVTQETDDTVVAVSAETIIDVPKAIPIKPVDIQVFTYVPAEDEEISIKLAERQATINGQIEYAITVKPEIQVVADELVPAEIALSMPADINVPVEITTKPAEAQPETEITTMELKVTTMNNQPADIFDEPGATTKSDDKVESQEISNNPAQVINVPTETTDTWKLLSFQKF